MLRATIDVHLHQLLNDNIIFQDDAVLPVTASGHVIPEWCQTLVSTFGTLSGSGRNIPTWKDLRVTIGIEVSSQNWFLFRSCH